MKERVIMLNDVDNKLKILESKKPFSKATLNSLHEKVILDWIYNSNAIEGNTLTLKETKVVMEGITVGGKALREHFEVINHKEAISYVEGIVKNREKLTEWQIKNIHSLILKNIDFQNAGKYRNENVIISGAEHVPPSFLNLDEEMRNLILWYNEDTSHPIEKATKLHSIFVKIHPFIDGNGRTARLLLNFELMKHGYLPVVIKNENRLEYYKALDKSHITGDYSDFIDIVANLEIEMIDLYLKIV